MDDPKDSPLRKAEESARRVFERLGSAIDKKVLGRSTSEFGIDYIGDLASRIEKIIESSLKSGDAGKLSLAPNHFKVELTYEEASKLTGQQIESLSRELAAAAHEFIHNRRYQTEGPVEVEVVPDLFTTSITIKAEFDRGGESSASVDRGPSEDQNRTANDRHSVTLTSEDGHQYHLSLASGGAPLYIGRVPGNAIRLDDPSVSRIHCSVALRNDSQIVISDLDSANGTFVNGRVVNTGEAQKLEIGDDIQVGNVLLRVGRSEG
jgi:hypothetical protein